MARINAEAKTRPAVRRPEWINFPLTVEDAGALAAWFNFRELGDDG